MTQVPDSLLFALHLPFTRYSWFFLRPLTSSFSLSDGLTRENPWGIGFFLNPVLALAWQTLFHSTGFYFLVLHPSLLGQQSRTRQNSRNLFKGPRQNILPG